ncbi:hypothetical protein JB92DRAFT_2834144 [Gautieria morchelliformis]|nr:hypothetical protein JB92DRAFT_2834144 [Gautieria morchelliformis]
MAMRQPSLLHDGQLMVPDAGDARMVVLLIGSSLVGASGALNLPMVPDKGIVSDVPPRSYCGYCHGSHGVVWVSLPEKYQYSCQLAGCIVAGATGHIKAAAAITFLCLDLQSCPAKTTGVLTFKIGVWLPPFSKVLQDSACCSYCSMLDDMPVACNARRESIPCMKILDCTVTVSKGPLPQEMDRNVSAEAREVSSRCRGCREYVVPAHCLPP